MDKKLKSFISYAHDNQQFKESFEKKLVLTARKMGFVIWSDAKISPGKEWFIEINANLDSSHLILLLLSKQFVNSTFCNQELSRAIELYDEGKATVIPIVLDDNELDITTLACSKLQYSPVVQGRVKAVVNWTDHSEAFTHICNQLESILQEIQRRIDNTDPKFRFNEIQDLIANSDFQRGFARLLDYCREFCEENAQLQNKICINRGVLIRLESDSENKNKIETIKQINELLEDSLDAVFQYANKSNGSIN